MKIKNEKSGITLIALIITIIVLLILAGVSISIVIGDNGILNQAVNGADRTNIARELEMLQMAVSGSLNEKLEINGDNLRTNIENGLGNNDFEFTDNGDGSYKVKINSSDRLYYIEENGNIISPENMIEIGTAEELKTFRDEVNSGNTYEGWYIYLTNDITLDINEIWEPIGLYPMESTTPDAETNKPFSGVFDGHGHKIDEIYINTTDKAQGLFGLVNTGKIMNLSIGENCNIKGDLGTASIVGVLFNNSQIINCTNKSNLTVGQYSGGIAAECRTNSKIINCSNYGNITGNTNARVVGGITGQLNENSKIYNCYNTGNITSIAQNYYGGICGNTNGNNNIIEKCFNSGEINSDTNSSNIGGIVGGIFSSSIRTQVNECYNKGNITGYNGVSGICGLNQGEISNCYNTGNISGNHIIGGIIGNNQYSLSNCYNIGIINGNSNEGSIAGQNHLGTINNCYSLENVSSKLCGNIINPIGEECSFKTSSELQGLYTILGSEFKEDTENINNGYPILNWQ